METSVVEQLKISSATIGTHLISNVVWIHVTLLWYSGTQGAESTEATLCNAGIKASSIGK